MKKLVSILIILLLLSSCSPEKIEVNSVFYEIYVGSFYDSDGDGHGDLNGVKEKLDYLQDLGATGIWLMPIHPSPTYHKYDVVDYLAIDPDYGTMEDFDALVKEMDKREMNLILDFVLNHSSSQHPWFLDALSAKINDKCDEVTECGYYHFSEEPQPGFAHLQQDLYYEAVFWDQMPDLNLDNEDLRDEITNIAKFYLEKGADGFRLDATTHFYRENLDQNIDFLSWFNSMIKEINPNAYLVGEAWTSDSIVTNMYESQVDSFFNFTMAQVSGKIVKAINLEEGQELAIYVKNYQDQIEGKNPQAINAVFLSNHDNNRSAGYLPQLERQKLAASLYLLMPGNVFIYYGEEIAMKGSGRDENKRLPMVWSFDEPLADPPKEADYQIEQSHSVETMKEDKESLWYHYQKVLAVRNKYSKSIARNDFKVLEIDEKAYAMDHGDVLVIHNLGSKEIELDLQFSKFELIDGTFEDSTLSGYSSVVLIK